MNERAGDPSRFVVEVAGLGRFPLRALEKSGMTPERWRSVLVVRVIPEGAAAVDETPPLSGTYRIDGDTLRFEPRFPTEPGVRYRAEFRLHALRAMAASLPGAAGGIQEGRDDESTTVVDFSKPRPTSQPTAIVTAVYPSRAALPENLLRFYIHFSAPMSRGEAYRHIRLRDASGRPVPAAFLELGEELWSNDGKRFTLLFDPGRIKRGLKPREDLGPVLEAGRSYEVVVDRGWPDAAGNPLKADFRKAFRTGPADETSPDPKAWAVRPPSAMTRAPLEVRFPEPLNRAQLDRLIAVRDGSDRAVAGSISVADEEMSWRFTPDVPWRSGSYRLVVGTDLEDVAGNSVTQPFEVDAFGPISRRVTGETVALPFEVAPQPR